MNLCHVNNFHANIREQEMTKREYVEDQDAEDPDDFIISLTTQVGQPTLI